MKPVHKGLAIAVIHILIVLSVGGKLLYDRSHRPRVWVRTGQVDPDLPIRGRYLTLSLEVRASSDLDGEFDRTKTSYAYVELAVENGELVAHRTERPTGMTINSWSQRRKSGDIYLLGSPVVFFVPEHAETPRLGGGAELWAEVTVPKQGPPRPLQLAVKRGQEWIPLTYR